MTETEAVNDSETVTVTASGIPIGRDNWQSAALLDSNAHILTVFQDIMCLTPDELDLGPSAFFTITFLISFDFLAAPQSIKDHARD